MNKFLLKIKKKTFLQLLLLLSVAMLFLFPLFKNDFYLSHDGEAHVARFSAYIKAVNDGQFPFRWAGDLNYRYGSPLMIFYYPLPGVISVPFYHVGINLEDIFKIAIGLSFVLSFISFYFWIRELTEDNELAVIGGVVYGLVPYHFLNLYVRGGIAELLALAFVPFVLFYIEKVSKEKDVRYMSSGAIFYTLLILSHNSVSLLFSPVFVIYALIRAKSRMNFFKSLIMLGLGLGMSAFFWLPAIIESRYTNAKLFIGNMFMEQFPPLSKLFYSPWGFGADVNKPGGLSPQIGIINWIFVFVSLFMVFKEKKKRSLLIFWIGVFLFSTLLITSLSAPFWQVVPLLKNLQFPWRIVAVSSFATAVLIVLVLKTQNKAIRFIVAIGVILYSMQFLGVNYIPRKPDSFYMNYPATTYYHGEASSIWTAGDFSSFPKKSIELIGGKAKIENIVRKSHVHSFTINVSDRAQILDNTVYFPGWQVRSDGNRIPIQFQDSNNRGLITFELPQGKHNVLVEFRESLVRLASNYISIASVVLVLLLVIFNNKINRAIKR